MITSGKLAKQAKNLGIHITAKEIDDNQWLRDAVEEYIESADKCAKCTSAEQCSQKSKGVMLDIDVKRASISVKPCPKYEQYKLACKMQQTHDAAKISNDYKRMTLGSMDDNRVNKARDVIDRGQWLFAYGGTGTGKTHMAVAILQDLLEKGQSGLFCVVPSLMNELRKLIMGDSGKFYKLIDDLTSCDVLVLDDLGAEKATDKSGEWLYMIINERYISNKRTLITSNLDLVEISDQLGSQGSRIASRIAGKANVVKLGGKDRRMIKEGAK